MKLFHSTTVENAAAIVADGFQDAADNYMTTNAHKGVWLSNVALDENEGAASGALLEIELPEDVLAVYEWVEDRIRKGYREWLIPAEAINSNMKLRLVPEDEAEEIRASRWGEERRKLCRMILKGGDSKVNLLQTKRANVIRLEAELNAARKGGASHISKVREAQKELSRERAELAKLEARLSELKQHLECLTDL